MKSRLLQWILGLLAVAGTVNAQNPQAPLDPLAWPAPTRESRPWSYWWWLGSAVDPINLSNEMQRYREAGWGGVHIIPIYGAKGWEAKYLPYLGPKWMGMLEYVCAEGRRMDLGVDMTMGSGWCFGGPTVGPLDANALAVAKTFDVAAGEKLKDKLDRAGTQALMAFGPDGQTIDLTAKIGADGQVDFTAPAGAWRVYAISQRPSGQKVKRAAPGGEGPMLNLFYNEAMPRYLQRFTDAFATYRGSWPRAMYHDSYEYRSDWAPNFFAQFEKRRGYRLQNELPALFGKEETESAARVKCDYRETISDIMAEETLPTWTRWCRERGMITRNQAHGSPGNLLDLYAAADIPETEMFNQDRNILVSKCASSAAHVMGRRLVASETGTWLKEHFTETLADMKYLQDDLFLSGVNHIVYHGTCYSPDEAAWPGWLFYASYEMNPRNPIWRDVPALNAYAARCQSILQSGASANDVLVYWPIHDRWQNAKGMAQPFTVHAREWLEDMPFGKAAARLWARGFAFDYVSDRQLALANTGGGTIEMPGGKYRVVVVPKCELMPETTLTRLLSLAQSGATVVFEQQLPKDVPGLASLEKRRGTFKSLLGAAPFAENAGVRVANLGAGRWIVGELEPALAAAGVARESLTDHQGLMFIRRAFANGRHYFIVNRGAQAVNGWTPLAFAAKSVAILDPLSGRTGIAATRTGANGQTEVRLQMEPGHSLILRAFADRAVEGTAWDYLPAGGDLIALVGKWAVKFVQGGPELPPDAATDTLKSWTALNDSAQAFGGTAIYSLRFDAPAAKADRWLLDLGKVSQSARVRVNGQDLGTLLVPPFRAVIKELNPKENLLEVEVTSTAANRIRDLDRRKVSWKTFNDINIVNQGYKPFDASAWPLADAGLLGPVTLAPLVK